MSQRRVRQAPYSAFKCAVDVQRVVEPMRRHGQGVSDEEIVQSRAGALTGWLTDQDLQVTSEVAVRRYTLLLAGWLLRSPIESRARLVR